MNQSQFITNYQKFLRANTNKEHAQKAKAYLYSDLKHYGIGTVPRHQFFLSHQKELATLTKPQALALTRKLWSLPSFEERALALGILNLHGPKLDKSDMPLIERLMRESRGWAFLDNLIIPLMPGLLEKNPSLYQYLNKWIKDNDFWVRRSALLAQLLFFRAGRGGRPKLFFQLAKSQLNESWINKVYEDTESRKRARFFIRKAIGWSLRELSIKNPQAVLSFVQKHKSKMSGLTLREATRKIPASLSKQSK